MTVGGSRSSWGLWLAFITNWLVIGYYWSRVLVLYAFFYCWFIVVFYLDLVRGRSALIILLSAMQVNILWSEVIIVDLLIALVFILIAWIDFLLQILQLFRFNRGVTLLYDLLGWIRTPVLERCQISTTLISHLHLAVFASGYLLVRINRLQRLLLLLNVLRNNRRVNAFVLLSGLFFQRCITILLELIIDFIIFWLFRVNLLLL